MTNPGFEEHDHDACVSGALSVAEAHCAERGLKLTPTRRRVLEILLSQHRAMGAYDLLPILANEGLGSQPPVAYRALEFLVTNGFAHKVEKLSAYVACSYSGQNHSPAFMICRQCAAVVETTTARDAGALGRAAKSAGFTIETAVVEAEGLCPACQTEGANA